MVLKDVLVVDDESLMRDALELSLQGEFKVVKACSGSEAIALSEKKTFPVVVLDLRMEGLDGIATLKQLRQKNIHQKIVILTAHQSLDSAIQAINLGAHNYMTKPCDFRELREVLSKAHDRYYEEMARTEELRKRLMEMHDDFFSVLCHEFNTPLNGIIGFASILKDELDDEGQKRMAGFIERSAENLHGVFVEILDHIQSKLPVRSGPINTFSLAALTDFLNSKRETWDRDFQLLGDDWHNDELLEAPYHTLTVIFSKLILASNPSFGQARIHLQRLDNQLKFKFSNLDLESHVGSLSDPDKIFSPYIASNSTRRRFDSGLGLNLATSKNLADTAGMQLSARKDDSGLIEISLMVDLPGVAADQQQTDHDGRVLN